MTLWVQLQRQISSATTSCTADEFLGLSKLAVAAYQEAPDRGEDIAGRMSSVWLLHRGEWRNGAPEQIGRLFADLDLPADHVVGGVQGARRKWYEIERLVRNG